MIIRRYHSENILKYRELSLEALPEQGLIVIEGPNEAGKSAIAESICLGLFGRTFAYPEADYQKAIKWGAANASIEMQFQLPDGQSYQVERYFDVDGQHSARLAEVKDNTPKDKDQNTLAQGPDAVNRRIQELIHIDFQQYIDAFYLAQREFSIPNAQSQMLKGLLGIADMDKVHDELRWEIQQNQQRIDRLNKDIADAEATLQQLDADDAHLEQAEKAQSQALDGVEDANQRLSAEEQRADHLHQQLAGLISTLADTAEHNKDQPWSQWRNSRTRLQQQLELLDEACQQQPPIDSIELDDAKDFQRDYQGHIDSFLALQQRANGQAEQWKLWLDESDCDQDTAPGHERYRCQCETIKRQRPQLKKSRTLALITGLIASLAGATTALSAWAHQQASAPAIWQQLQASLNQNGLNLETLLGNAQQTQTILYAGGAIALIGFILLIKGARAANRLGKLNDQVHRLERQAETARREIHRIEQLPKLSLLEACESLAQLHDDTLLEQLAQFEDQAGQILLNDDRWALFIEPVHKHRERLVEQEQAANEQLQTLHAQAQANLEARDIELEQAENQLNTLLGEREQAEQLQAQIRNAEAALYEPQDQIQVRDYALKLIAGASRRVYTRFNQQMRDYLGKLLPLFTEARYQHLKIDDDFSVQVFSADKNDFVNLDDLSSGTQRQLILAIRLAMSQALVDSRIQGPQLLILDEPFAFFDRERMEQTLATLPNFSPDISQVIVISQEFSEDAPVDLRISADRSDDRIIV